LDVVDAPRELEHLRHRAAQHGRVPFRELGEVDVPVPVKIELAEQLLAEEQIRPAHLRLHHLVKVARLLRKQNKTNK
jgi:hypothetical protein